MIPIEKSNQSEVEKVCVELYTKMNFQDYPEFKKDLNSWITSNVPELASEKDAFLKIMTGEYAFLEKCKGLLENFINKEPKLTEYLKKSYGKIDSKLRKRKLLNLNNEQRQQVREMIKINIKKAESDS